MRMDKLTSRFQQALADAQSLAVGRDHNMLEPVHVLTALLDQQGGSTQPMLAQAGVNVAALRTRLGQILDRLPKVSGQEGNLGVGNTFSPLMLTRHSGCGSPKATSTNALANTPAHLMAPRFHPTAP